MEEMMKKLNYQPTRLTDMDIEEPNSMISSFFVDNPIHEVRANIWQLYQGWVYHSCRYANDEMIEDMMLFYEHLIDFVDATYILTEKANFDTSGIKGQA